MFTSKDVELAIDNEGELADKYGRFWAVLCDKDYQGLMKFFKAIYPAKKPQNRSLANVKVTRNVEVSSDWLLVKTNSCMHSFFHILQKRFS